MIDTLLLEETTGRSVMFPLAVSNEDGDWVRASILMRCIPLDLRSHAGQPWAKAYKMASVVPVAAEDLLVRPLVWDEGRRVPAPYFEFTLRFVVSGSVHGRIPVGDKCQLGLFHEVVGSAIEGSELQASGAYDQVQRELMSLWMSGGAVTRRPTHEDVLDELVARYGTSISGSNIHKA